MRHADWAVSGFVACAAISVLLSSRAIAPLPEKRNAQGRVLSICELSRDFTAYSGQMIAVRGAYYNGLRQSCPQRCPNGEPWPSVLDLLDSSYLPPGVRPTAEARIPFATDRRGWDKVERLVLEKAKTAEKVEIWATFRGILADQRRSPLGPCDLITQGMWFGRYARGRYGASLVVKSVEDIEVRANPATAYDYTTYLKLHHRIRLATKSGN